MERTIADKAFTMAEILISLTIIGVIAAITLPSLRANINEKTWATQRKALYSRMSQAISMLPSLNGYGNFQGTWEDDVVTPTKDTAAASFVTDGLAKVLNINNICSIPMGTSSENARKELKKCGIPSTLTTMKDVQYGRTSKIVFPTKLSELNPMFTSTYTAGGVNYYNTQHDIDTVAAAFETKNSESVAVFYNPYCQSDMGEIIGGITHNPLPKMCANFIYDLNGKKGPNKVGKDIGFITALYSTNSEVVAPMPTDKSVSAAQTDAASICRKLDYKAPNINEVTAMFYNRKLLNMSGYQVWSSTLSISDNSKAWVQYFGYTSSRCLFDKSFSSYIVRCIKR